MGKTSPKDIDFAQHQLVVRSGKGDKDRITILPDSLHPPLKQHLQHVKRIHTNDLALGHGDVYLPYALAVNIPRPAGNGAGNMLFRLLTFRPILVPANSAATIATKAASKNRLRPPLERFV